MFLSLKIIRINSGSVTPRTPRRQQRGDIHTARSAKRFFDLDVEEDNEDVTMLEAEHRGATTDQIWGTTIKVDEVRKSFKKFLEEFRLSDQDGRFDDKLFYIEYLRTVRFQILFLCKVLRLHKYS